MSQSSATPVQTVATVCDASPEAVISACRILGYRTLGGLILKRAYEFDSHFCAEVRMAESAIRAQKQRKGGGGEETRYPHLPADAIRSKALKPEAAGLVLRVQLRSNEPAFNAVRRLVVTPNSEGDL